MRQIAAEPCRLGPIFAFAQSKRPSWRPSWILLRNKVRNESVCVISVLFIKVMRKITPNPYQIVKKNHELGGFGILLIISMFFSTYFEMRYAG